jgi:branched-chain amino acid transport system ATP-binding protein
VSVILKLEELRGGYGTIEVVRGLSMEVRCGQIYSLVGKNGMGKSTLLKLILGLVPPQAGRVHLDGAEVTGLRPNEVVARSVSYVPQEQALFQDLSVGENLRLGSLSMPRAAFETRMLAVSEFFPFLRDRLRQRAGTLSGGEQKMLLLARAVLPQPKLVLVDEVTEGVQPTVVARMRDVLVETRKASGMSVLLVEQNMDFAFGLADRFGVLNQGVLIDEGDPAVAGARQRAEAHLTF